MTRRDAERLDDILDAIRAIRSHLGRGDLSDGLVYDAVRVRLIEIGEAVKSLPAEIVATEPGLPWRDRGHARQAGAPLLRHAALHRAEHGRERPASSRADRAPPPGGDRLRRSCVIFWAGCGP